MPALTVVYARSHQPIGILIRNADLTGNRWSHCGLVDMQAGTVIEAAAFRGVVETIGDEFCARYPGLGQRGYVDIECPNPAAALAWARTQIGKGYDYLAIAGVLARKSWQRDDKWTCAELLERALIAGGRQRFRDSPAFISPNISWMTV